MVWARVGIRARYLGGKAYQVVELIVLDCLVSPRPFASVAAASNTMLLNPPAATQQQQDQAASGHAGLAPNIAFPTEPIYFGRAQAEILGAEPQELVSLLRLAESGGASSSSAASSSRSAVLQLLATVPTAAAQASAATARPGGVDAASLRPTAAAMLEQAVAARAQPPKPARASDYDEITNPKQYRRIMKRRQARAKYAQLFPDARPSIIECYYGHDAARRSGKKVRAHAPNARVTCTPHHVSFDRARARRRPPRSSRTSTSRATSTRARASVGRGDAS